MSLAFLFRWVPTPKYGNCGGRTMDCSLGGFPVDAMDRLFMEHDMNLYAARQLDTEYEKKIAYKEADQILYVGLKRIDPSSLSLYGRLYRAGAMAAFK